MWGRWWRGWGEGGSEVWRGITGSVGIHDAVPQVECARLPQTHAMGRPRLSESGTAASGLQLGAADADVGQLLRQRLPLRPLQHTWDGVPKRGKSMPDGCSVARVAHAMAYVPVEGL